MRGGHTGPDTLMPSHNPPKMCRTEGGGRWWGGGGERSGKGVGRRGGKVMGRGVERRQAQEHARTQLCHKGSFIVSFPGSHV